VPAELTFQTQPEIAASLIKRLYSEKVLPFGWMIADEHFGNNPVLLDRIAAAQLTYFMEAPHNTLVWRERPPHFRTATFWQERATAAARALGCPSASAEPSR
jgi:SRSO17 transposase